MAPHTRETVSEFIGGGNRDLSDSEKDFYADNVAAAANSFDRWAETRSLEERISPRTSTVQDENGETTTVESRPFEDGPISTPEGFGGADATDDDDDDEFAGGEVTARGDGPGRRE